MKHHNYSNKKQKSRSRSRDSNSLVQSEYISAITFTISVDQEYVNEAFVKYDYDADQQIACSTCMDIDHINMPGAACNSGQLSILAVAEKALQESEKKRLPLAAVPRKATSMVIAAQ